MKEWAEKIKFLSVYRAQSEALMILCFLEEEELHTSVYNRKCKNLNLKKKINRESIKTK